MRLPKYRAWHEKHNKMFSAEEMGRDQLTLMPDGSGFINVSGRNTRESQFLHYMIPLEFTGLKDKNGKEIYEGDICKGSTETLRTVIWDEDRCGFRFNTGADLIHAVGRWELIGNIYENKELLKGEIDERQDGKGES